MQFQDGDMYSLPFSLKWNFAIEMDRSKNGWIEE